MDPVSTLGLAGNIVQFVDFSWKLWCETRTLYQSSTGALAENDDFELITTDLIRLDDALRAPSTASAIPDQIRQLASRCREVASELLELLDKIKLKGPHKRWKSFVMATRSVWKKDQIEGLLTRMERLRNEMQFRLQWMLSEGNLGLQATITKLVNENKRLGIDQTQQLASQLQSIHGAVSDLQSEAKSQNKALHDVYRAVSRLETEADSQKGSEQDVSDATKGFTLIDNNISVRWASQMEGLFSQLSSLSEEIKSTASDQMLLRSLYFTQIRDRQTNIAVSHEKTFQWLLNPSAKPYFAQWLQSGSGIYWINGKAGSGKSTLMKFLVNHSKTKEALKSWAGNRKLVTASFYFWNAGTLMQKTQVGLFRSLLYEILRQCPDLIPIICASKTASGPFVEDVEPWTQEELWQAIEKLREQTGAKARFCFFIDGLDEYDGESDHIIDMLESLRKWPDIKLCVSSRPWNAFIDAFGQESDSQLALEDLTRKDIMTYVKYTLEKNALFEALKERDARSHDLIRQIVSKARGVFLWVVLVVRSLLDGLRNADKIHILQKRLEEFPDTLEKYFAKIIFSIENIYQEQTAQAFAYAIAAVEPLSLLTYSFLDEENLDAVPINPLSLDDIRIRHDEMRRSLNGRCKGLLEVVNEETSVEAEYDDLIPEYNNLTLKPKVDFLHRTAYDFILTKDVQSMLAKNLKPGFEPERLLCHAFLAQLKALDLDASAGIISPPRKLLEDLVIHAQRLEDKSGDPQIALMDETNALVTKRANHFGLHGGEHLFLEFLVHRGLYLYFADVLERKWRASSIDKNLLLTSAFDVLEIKYPKQAHDLKMIELILEHGASPSTVWGTFVRSIHERAWAASKPVEDHILKVAEILVCYGADLQHRSKFIKSTLPRRRVTGRVADLLDEHLNGQEDTYRTMTAREVLQERFGEQKTEKVFEKARVKKRSIFARLKTWRTFS